MSPLFRNQDQQDSQECLQCILLFIQEAVRTVNRQRAMHQELTSPSSRSPSSGIDDGPEPTEMEVGHLSESKSRSLASAEKLPAKKAPPTSSDALRTAEGAAVSPDGDCMPQSSNNKSSPLPKNVQQTVMDWATTCGYVPESSVRASNGGESSSGQGHNGSSSPGSKQTEADCLRNSVPKDMPEVSCRIYSGPSKPTGVDSLRSSSTREERAPPASAGISSLGPKPTSPPPGIGRITDYFGRAAAPPNSLSDITVATTAVADLVEALFEGKCDRATKCQECDSVTRRSETFQCIDVAAQKARKVVVDELTDNDHDDGEEHPFSAK